MSSSFTGGTAARKTLYYQRVNSYQRKWLLSNGPSCFPDPKLVKWPNGQSTLFGIPTARLPLSRDPQALRAKRVPSASLLQLASALGASMRAPLDCEGILPSHSVSCLLITACGSIAIATNVTYGPHASSHRFVCSVFRRQSYLTSIGHISSKVA